MDADIKRPGRSRATEATWPGPQLGLRAAWCQDARSPFPGPSLTAKTQSWQPQYQKVSGSEVRDLGGAGSPLSWVRPQSLVCYCLVITGDREALWAELKAGAESGWDFSSRWLVGGLTPNPLSSIQTSRFVPVDLNAFLCQAEELMSDFYSRLGELASGRRGGTGARPASALPQSRPWSWK